MSIFHRHRYELVTANDYTVRIKERTIEYYTIVVSKCFCGKLKSQKVNGHCADILMREKLNQKKT